MMDRFLRLASIVLVAAGLAACDDDPEVPAGETSTVNISVFVENDAETGLIPSAGDTPIPGASVELVANEGGETRTATTSAGGIATFTDVPAGVYTVTHTPTPPITNATLTSAASQTVVAQFEGGTSTAAFIYSFNPGAIAGQFFRDENDNDTFEADIDVTLAGFQAILFAGTDTTADEIDSATTDDTGTFAFANLAPGDFTIVVRPILGSEVTDTTVAVTVPAGGTADVLIEFTGGEQVTDIAVARDLAAGTAVTVQGVVTAGTNVFSSSNFYIQDSTGGVVVFIGGGPDIDVAIGDSLQVSGTMGAFSGEVQISGGAAMSIEVLGTGDVPTPRVVTATDVNAGLFQGELVEAMGVTIDSISGGFGFNENLFVHDATGDFVVFIDGTTGIDSSYISFGSTYNITGIMTIFGTTLEIKPRSAEDLELTTTPTGTVPISIARLLPDDRTATVEGVVIAGTGTFSTSSLYVQDNSAGILVFHGSSAAPHATGDSIRIAGTLDTFSGERELANVTITALGTGTLPTPESITAAELNAGQMQSELVVADSIQVVSVSTSGSGNVTVVATDDTGELTIFADVDTGLTAANFTVGSSYAVTGVAASFNSLRQIKPRSAADVTAL